MDNLVIVFDIDGTLANVDHRRQFVASKPKNWPAWNAAMYRDTVHSDIKFIWDCFTMMNVNHPTYEDKIIRIFCSGRGEEYRPTTENWLKEHGIYFDKLYMRGAGDVRKDSIVKVELLQEIRKDYGNPFLWFDDRQQVVDAIRAEGVRVLQVAEGNF